MEEAVAAWKDARCAPAMFLRMYIQQCQIICRSYVLRLSKEEEIRQSRPQLTTGKKRKLESPSTSPAWPQESEISEDDTSNIPTSDPREEDMPAPSNGIHFQHLFHFSTDHIHRQSAMPDLHSSHTSNQYKHAHRSGLSVPIYSLHIEEGGEEKDERWTMGEIIRRRRWGAQ
jgi:hypothetical protein